MTDEQRALAIECGKRVKNEAKRKKKTQEELKADVHMSLGLIRKIFQGERMIQEYQAEIFASYFNVRKEYLLGIDNDRTEEDRKKRLFSESFDRAHFFSQYQNQILRDACSFTPYQLLNVVVNQDDPNARFRYLIKVSETRNVEIDESKLDLWLENCMKYAAFTLDLLVKEQL